MIPRLSTSKKWTEMPPELTSQIQSVFEEHFEEACKNGKLIIEGRIYPEELLLRVGYLPQDQLRQANFEVSLEFNPKKQNALEKVHFLVDCAAAMLNEYLEEKDLEPFPKAWKSLVFDKQEVFIQVSTVNTELEAEADRILGESIGKNQEALVRGEDDGDHNDDPDSDDPTDGSGTVH